MSRELNPEHAAANGYTRSDWDEVGDNPEWTASDLASAKPLAQAMPEIHAAIAEAIRRRGPVRRKTPVSIRLDDDLLDKLRASGPGWQSRVNEVLRHWVEDAA
ncbi:BrnA antitoxin family protein [Aureimonas sp. AU4]|uniref:BrnA antitoxin family protein n=1 Tax=Aureimonas sp. AU4 TaxID=1638163 RepID=UPI000782BA4A|nr:BrnA antitoxin family protein [Aureimonas sp. AU4]